MLDGKHSSEAVEFKIVFTKPKPFSMVAIAVGISFAIVVSVAFVAACCLVSYKVSFVKIQNL